MTKLGSLAALALLAVWQQPSFAQPIWNPIPFNRAAPAAQPAPGTCSPLGSPAPTWPAPTTCPTPGCDPCPQSCNNNKVYVFADFLYLRAQGADIPYAQPMDGITPLAVPAGPVAVASNDYSTGFRVGAGAMFGNGNYIQGSYTGFRSTSSDSVEAPAGTVLRSLLTFPATANSAFDSLASSLSQEIQFSLIDIDFKHRFLQADGFSMNWLVGARYAQLQQTMNSNFTILGATSVGSNIDFNGGGLRVGLEGELCGHTGFFLYGRGVASFLAGRFSSTYTQTNVFAGVQASTGVDENRVVPIFDIEAGVGWQSKSQRVRLMAGYYFSHWTNVLTTNSLIQGVQNSNFTTNGDNFRDSRNFDGFTARLEFRF